MAIDHSKLRYSPTLRLRVHEMRALEQLFDEEKQNVLPTILVRPWTTATTISKGLDRIVNAMDGRPFCVDLDPLYRFDKGHPNAIAEIRGYYENDNSWYALIEEYPECIPYLRLGRGLPNLNSSRLRWIQERGFAIALRYPFAELNSILDFVGNREDSNFFVNIDAGWHTEILLRQSIVNETARTLANANPRIKIVITASTFPNSFDGIGIGAEHYLSEIDLYESAAQAVRLSSNEAEAFYGDWATTRPPFDQGGGNPWPRIDLPSSRSVQMFRRKASEEELMSQVYEELAEIAVESSTWDDVPDCWGKYIIDLTAAGSTGGIRQPNMNVSPRINMHMHNQIVRLNQNVGPGGIEEYED